MQFIYLNRLYYKLLFPGGHQNLHQDGACLMFNPWPGNRSHKAHNTWVPVFIAVYCVCINGSDFNAKWALPLPTT